MSEVAVRIDPLRDLEASGALTRTGLVLPNTITYERYEALGALLGEMHQVVQWACGDWLIAGEALFSEQESQASEIMNLSEESRKQYAWVAKKIPIEKRRRELSWGHHRAVASMKDERERDELLDQAVANRWTTRELEEHKRNPPVGELPEPPLEWRYRTLLKAAEKVWETKDMMSGGAMFAVPSVVIDELGVALGK